MEPGDIKAATVGVDKMGEDLVQGQRRGVDYERVGRRCGHNLGRHQRTRIEADRAAFDQPEPAERDQIGRAGSSTDEMHRHKTARSK